MEIAKIVLRIALHFARKAKRPAIMGRPSLTTDAEAKRLNEQAFRSI